MFAPDCIECLYGKKSIAQLAKYADGKQSNCHSDIHLTSTCPWPCIHIMYLYRLVFLHHLIQQNNNNKIVIRLEMQQIKNSWFSELARKPKELNINKKRSRQARIISMKKDDQGQVDTKRNTQLQQHYKQKKKLRFLQRKLPGISIYMTSQAD